MANIFFDQRGNGSPLIFLHGFPMHRGVWDAFGDRFKNSNTVITPDLPGFGKSPILPPGFSLAQVAEQLIQFVEDKAFNNCVLIGHSLGGYVALAMAEKRTGLVCSTGIVSFYRVC
jgi:pimeloyl-ACP methyl ester carboxylesterase